MNASAGRRARAGAAIAGVTRETMDKTYRPAEVEARRYREWEESGAFACAVSAGREADGARPYSIVIPPPNVTGSLHMGHALNNTLQDVLIRFARMRGRDALWQPGTDHAGIATQMVVERQLAAEGKTRHDLGREAFIDRIWSWKAESGGAITGQLRRLGASCDWHRERFTMDDGLSAAVRRVFVTLYKEGVVYRDKRLVNWDPKLHTAISDLEVEQRAVEGKLWTLNYPVEAEDEPGAEVIFGGGFPTGNGRGRFVPAAVLPPDELPDERFPMILTTGRLLEHWHTGAMTRRAQVLDRIEPEAIAAMNPRDLRALQLVPGAAIRVETRRGVIELGSRADPDVPEGVVFIPFCYAEAAANLLTNPALDPVGKIPEFKFCAARITPAREAAAAE